MDKLRLMMFSLAKILAVLIDSIDFIHTSMWVIISVRFICSDLNHWTTTKSRMVQIRNDNVQMSVFWCYPWFLNVWDFNAVRIICHVTSPTNVCSCVCVRMFSCLLYNANILNNLVPNGKFPKTHTHRSCWTWPGK